MLEIPKIDLAGSNAVPRSPFSNANDTGRKNPAGASCSPSHNWG